MAVRLTVYGTADMRQISKARQELDRLEKTALANSTGFTASMTRFSNAATNAGRSISNTGDAMTRGLTLPLMAVGAGLYKATQAAADDAQQQVVLANTLRNTTGATQEQIQATEDWIATQGKNLGVMDDQLRPAINSLATATGDLTKAQQLAAIAMDISAAKGVPVETAANALAKAYAGNTMTLGRMLPGLSKATLASGDLGKIMGEVNKIVGGQAAAAANTEAGARARANVALQESIESLGTAFLPIMKDVTTIVTQNVVPAIESVAKWFQSLDKGTRDNIVRFGLFLAAAGPVVSILGRMVTLAGSTANGIVKIAEASTKAYGGLQNLYTGMTNASAGSSAFATPMMRLGGVIRTASIATKDFIVDLAKQGVALATQAGQWIASTASIVANKVALVASRTATALATAAQWALNAAMTANPIGIVVVAIGALVAALVVLFRNNQTVRNAMIGAWNAIKGAVNTVWNWLKGVITQIIRSYVDLARKMVNLGRDIAQGIVNGVKSLGSKIFDAITSPVTNAVNWVKDKLGIASPSRVTTAIGVNIGEGFANGIGSQVSNVANQATALANAAVGPLNTALYNVDRQAAAQSLSEGGVLKLAENLGLNLKTVTDAALGSEKAIAKVDKALAQVRLNSPQGLDAQGQPIPNKTLDTTYKFAKLLKEVQRELKATGSENDRLNKALGKAKDFDTWGFIEGMEPKVEKAKKVIQKANDELKALVQRTGEIMKSWNIGEMVKKDVISTEQLLASIKDQAIAMQNWVANIASLKKAGLAKGVVSSLLAGGPAENASAVQALAGMTAEQLKEYNAAFRDQKKYAEIGARMQQNKDYTPKVSVAQGAVQVTINGNADGQTVQQAVESALNNLVLELRSA